LGEDLQQQGLGRTLAGRVRVRRRCRLTGISLQCQSWGMCGAVQQGQRSGGQEACQTGNGLRQAEFVEQPAQHRGIGRFGTQHADGDPVLRRAECRLQNKEGEVVATHTSP
jgi:hypothetical protein